MELLSDSWLVVSGVQPLPSLQVTNNSATLNMTHGIIMLIYDLKTLWHNPYILQHVLTTCHAFGQNLNFSKGRVRVNLLRAITLLLIFNRSLSRQSRHP